MFGCCCIYYVDRFMLGVDVSGLLMVGSIVGFIFIFTFKNQHLLQLLAMQFVRDCFLAGYLRCLSVLPRYRHSGVGLTSSIILFVGAYKSGMIKPTENFKLGLAAATGGIFFIYFLSFILGLFGINMSMFHGSDYLALGLVVVVAIAL